MKNPAAKCQTATKADQTANDAIPHYIVPLPTQAIMIIKVRLTVKATKATQHPISVKTP